MEKSKAIAKLINRWRSSAKLRGEFPEPDDLLAGRFTTRFNFYPQGEAQL